MTAGDALTLEVGGQIYDAWEEIQVERSLLHMSSHFRVRASTHFDGKAVAHPLTEWDPITIRIGSDVVMTGYADRRAPGFDEDRHDAEIAGRSKVQDLIDCMPDVPSGQFKGYRLDAIARALAAPYSIGVIVQAQIKDVLADTLIQRAETSYQYLERLCRLSSVLACDDERGNLVLTTTGSERAADALVQGVNVRAAQADIDVSRRFSRYVVKTQLSMTPHKTASVQTAVQGTATDPYCPRPRTHVSVAETGMTAAQATERAQWMARYAAARGAKAHVRVKGWRQSNGKLWRVNQLVSATIPYIGLDQDVLIAGVRFGLNKHWGRHTVLTVGPPEAFTPDPGQVKIRKSKGGKGKGGKGGNWCDVLPIG